MNDTPIFDSVSGDWRRVTTDEDGTPTPTPQPKVIAGAVTGIFLTVLLGAITAVTPDLLAPLGPWGTVAFGAIVALGSALAAYVKRPGNVS